MEGNVKLPLAAGRCGGLGGVVSPPAESGAKPLEPSAFLTKNSRTERLKRVERRTAGPSAGFSVEK